MSPLRPIGSYRGEDPTLLQMPQFGYRVAIGYSLLTCRLQLRKLPSRILFRRSSIY